MFYTPDEFYRVEIKNYSILFHSEVQVSWRGGSDTASSLINIKLTMKVFLMQ